MKIKQANYEKTLEKVLNEIKKYNPEKVILFGSRAKGCERYNSDIDIAVEGNFSFREKRRLREAVNYISGLFTVDLIFMDEVDKTFRDSILKEGRVLYEKNGSVNEN